MRVLEFKVDMQTLSKQPGCDFSNIVAGTNNYLVAKFNFTDEDWDGCEKTVSFWINEHRIPVVLNENNECLIPHRVCQEKMVGVSVSGKRHRYSIQTNKYYFKQSVV